MGIGADAGGVKVNVAQLKLQLSRNPAFKARIQGALRGRLPELLQQFSQFMAGAKALLAPKLGGRSPVIIVDDLEKIRGTGADQDIVQTSMEQVFAQFDRALHVDGWHAIWTAPPYLQLMNATLENLFDGCFVLPMVRLWERDAGRSKDEDGFQATRRCMRKRGNVDSLFLSDALFDELIWASSGHLRDLLRLLQDAVREVFKQADPAAPLNEVKVRRIVEAVGVLRKALKLDGVENTVVDEEALLGEGVDFATAAAESRALVFVLSTDFVREVWPKAERLFADDAAAVRPRVVLLKLRPCVLALLVVAAIAGVREAFTLYRQVALARTVFPWFGAGVLSFSTFDNRLTIRKPFGIGSVDLRSAGNDGAPDLTLEFPDGYYEVFNVSLTDAFGRTAYYQCTETGAPSRFVLGYPSDSPGIDLARIAQMEMPLPGGEPRVRGLVIPLVRRYRGPQPVVCPLVKDTAKAQ